MLKPVYVTSDGAWLRKDGQNLVVDVDGAERGRAPLNLLDGVVSFGRAGASPALLAACAEAGITVSHLDPNGRFLARVEGSAVATCCSAARSSASRTIPRARSRSCAASSPRRPPTSARGCSARSATTSRQCGRRRPRACPPQIARACLDFGQRVQKSVFECELEPAQWTMLRARLVAEIDPGTDGLRFYRLGSEGRRRVEHVGARPTVDLDAPLVI